MTAETDAEFTPTEREALAALAGLIIPASDAHGVPGADDPAIVANILRDARRQRNAVSAALAAFAGTDAGGEANAAAGLRERHPDAARLIQTLVVQAYYRDARVMRSLGIEVRAPFPAGYEVPQGDWSLLDPVRARPPLYRPTE